MIYEEAALEKHPKAKEFRPVKPLIGSRLIGWTFEVPLLDSFGGALASKGYAWVTRDGEVSRDILGSRGRAEKNLKEYVKSRDSAVKAEVAGGLE